MSQLEKALEEKEKGNLHFKNREFDRAISCYSKAIEHDKNNHLLYGNRAQAFLNINRPEEAVKDCDRALTLDPKYIKGYLRRGSAMKILGYPERAMIDFKKALDLEPHHEQAAKEVKALEKMLISKKGSLIEPISSDSNTNDFVTNGSPAPFPIRVVDPKSLSKPKQLVISKRTITRIPVNSYEFYCDWRELSDESSKLKYLTNIGPIKLGRIFTNSMEPLVFCDILKTLPFCEDPSFRSKLLYELSKTGQFKTLILFLEDHEEKILKDLIVDMKNHLDTNEINFFTQKVGAKFS